MNKKRSISIRVTVPHRSGALYRVKSLLWRFSVITTRLFIILRRAILSVPLFRNQQFRFVSFAALAIIIAAQLAAVISPLFTTHAYALGNAEALLSEKEPQMAKNLNYNPQKQLFEFDSKLSLQKGTFSSGGGGVTANAYADASKGMTVTDATNKVSFTLTPKFKTAEGQKDSNRIIYPLTNNDGWAVYTMTAIGTKEDIVLKSTTSDNLSFQYDMTLGDGLRAQVETDGSIGIYGNPLLSGDISAGTSKDKELLQKAKENAPKNVRLFTIPPPLVKETGKSFSEIRAKYELRGTTLTIHASGLKKGAYPLTIDPSVYVVTASEFLQGNNESNILFDTTNKLIKKNVLTGGQLSPWQTTTNLPIQNYGGGAVTAGGFVYQLGGNSLTSAGKQASTDVKWAQFDAGGGTIMSATPGDTSCSNWCSSSSYALPNPRSNMSVVAYNGYLYALGGNDESGPNTSGHKFNSVYVAKIGRNGEPRLWHPTDSDTSNNVFWYHDEAMTLPEARILSAAVAYNNKMYVIGGLDDSSSAGAASSTVWVADILPNGTLGEWSNGTSLAQGGPGAIYGANAVVYNDNLYIVGGANSVGETAQKSNTYYIPLKADGSLGDKWIHTNDFASGRTTGGGNNAATWGGYMYITGGCGATNAENICTNILSDTQMASINADGSLGKWTALSESPQKLLGTTIIPWRNKLYAIGGCSSVNTDTGKCTSGERTGVFYSSINSQGDISPIVTSAANGSGDCTGSLPTNCDLPSTGSIGTLHGASIINNSRLYVLGGCSDATCSSATGKVAFTDISTDGNLSRPSSCPTDTTASGGWCVMDATIPNGVAMAAVTQLNNTVYLVGGANGSNLTNKIFHAQINQETGVIGAWQSDTMTNVGATAVASSYAFTRASASSPESSPGNLYILGGCTNESCATTTQSVYKCTLNTSGGVSTCSTSGQLQLEVGVGAAGGALFGNYIYLTGGNTGNNVSGVTRYAKIDGNNNIVSTTSTTWNLAPATLGTAVSYASSFAHNGYLYIIGGKAAGTTESNTIQFIKINTDTGNLGTSWSTSNTQLPSGRHGQSAVVTNARAYIIGGCTTTDGENCTRVSSSVNRFRIYNNDSGRPTGYSESANPGTDVTGAGSVVLNGYIYQVGGCVAIDCANTTASTYYASLSEDGTIGNWNSGDNLPISSGNGRLVTTGDTLYYIGGQTNASLGSTLSSIAYTTAIIAGKPSWSLTTKGIGDTGGGSQKRTNFGAAVWNNRIYIVGGDDSTGSATSTVYVSPKLTIGGNITDNWTTGTDIVTARHGHSVVTYSNNLYVLGGDDGTHYFSDVQVAPINTSTGTPSSWMTASSLPQPVSGGSAFAANGYLYMVGGRSSSSSCTQNTYIAPISNNTLLASGNIPTGLGSWDTYKDSFGARYGAAASYSNGKVHLVGGGCAAIIGDSTGAPNNRIYSSRLAVQPQVANYSIAFDLDSNVFPQSFIINGIDNSIGGQWNLKYRTMSDPGAETSLGTGVDCSATPMNAWGQETNFGTLTLGTLGDYKALDSNGKDMSCGRYYLLRLSIDTQQSAGFPDDSSVSPSLSNINLRYTPSPQKRLLHGKTISGGN